MNKKIRILITVLIGIFLVGIFLAIAYDYGFLRIIIRNCQQDEDCIGTCSFGCISRKSIFRDPIKCEFLPFNCKCINNQCAEVEIEEFKDETADWRTYRNEEYGFEIKYPKDADIDEQDDRVSIWFPVSYEFLEKFAVITLDKNVTEEGLAEFNMITEKKDQIVYLGDTKFNKESGIGSVEGVFSAYYEIYSTVKEGRYFALIFSVFVASPEYTGIPTTGFNPYSEFYTFDEMASSLRFLE